MRVVEREAELLELRLVDLEELVVGLLTVVLFDVVGRLADVIDDEQAEHAGIFAATTNPEVPRTVNNPIRLGFAKPRTSGPPPAVGQHSDEILRELSYNDADIAALRKAGALG